MLAKITLAIVLIATIADESKSDTLFSDHNIRVGYFTDTNSISQTLMGGLMSEDRAAVLTITCDAAGSLLGGIMRRAGGNLGNSVRFTFENGNTESFRGRQFEASGMMKFNTSASKATIFLSDIDSVRMTKPANMRFINSAYKSDLLTVSFPYGDGTEKHRFDMASFKPWMQRIALECERSLKND